MPVIVRKRLAGGRGLTGGIRTRAAIRRAPTSRTDACTRALALSGGRTALTRRLRCRQMRSRDASCGAHATPHAAVYAKRRVRRMCTCSFARFVVRAASYVIRPAVRLHAASYDVRAASYDARMLLCTMARCAPAGRTSCDVRAEQRAVHGTAFELKWLFFLISIGRTACCAVLCTLGPLHAWCERVREAYVRKGPGRSVARAGRAASHTAESNTVSSDRLPLSDGRRSRGTSLTCRQMQAAGAHATPHAHEA
jgi:hypothetical protein